MATLAVLAGTSGCGPETTPEERIRALIRQGAEAAEARDLDALMELVAQDYGDDRGNDRRLLRALIGHLFRESRSIHVFYRVGSIEFPQEALAEIRLLVAVAGRPIDGGADLMRVEADLLRMELTATRAGSHDWRVTKASWTSAEPGDFL
jgi:hypothetical protein